MERPSTYWKGLDVLSAGSVLRKQIEHVMSSANFEHMKARAIESRRRYQPELALDIDCSINVTQFTFGHENLVLELEFSDKVYWIVRIPHRQTDDNVEESMLSEIATMRTVQQRTTIPVAQVFDFETTSDQPFGHPYILMECLRGQPTPERLAHSVPRQHVPKVAKQLANVLDELQNIMFDRIGRVWCGKNFDQTPDIMPEATLPLQTSYDYFSFKGILKIGK